MKRILRLALASIVSGIVLSGTAYALLCVSDPTPPDCPLRVLHSDNCFTYVSGGTTNCCKVWTWRCFNSQVYFDWRIPYLGESCDTTARTCPSAPKSPV